MTPVGFVVALSLLLGCGKDSPLQPELPEQQHADLLGIWQGFIDFQGMESRVEVELRPGATGNLIGVMHLRDLGVLDMPLSSVEVEDQTITVSTNIGLDFEGVIREDRRAFVGQLSTPDISWPLVLEKDNPAFRRFAVPRLGDDGEAQRDYTYQAPVQTDDGWAVSTLAAEGIDQQLIESVVEGILRGEHGRAEALLIARNGRLVLGEYFYGITVDRLHLLQSITKSVTSLLFGIVYDQALVDLDDLVYTFFPEYEGRKWVDLQYQINLSHLLTMSAAVDWNEAISYSDPRNSAIQMNQSPDWIGFVLDRDQAGTPGQISSYNSGLSILLGGVIHSASGKYVDELADETLFADLQVSRSLWSIASNGQRHTGGGLLLTARDLAKMGQLALDGGVWNGVRVLSEEWITESIRPHLPIGGSRYAKAYGYQWWYQAYNVNGEIINATCGLGYGGQFLGIFPSLNMVVAMNAGEWVDGALRQFNYNSIVENGILTAVQ